MSTMCSTIMRSRPAVSSPISASRSASSASLPGLAQICGTALCQILVSGGSAPITGLETNLTPADETCFT